VNKHHVTAEYMYIKVITFTEVIKKLKDGMKTWPFFGFDIPTRIHQLWIFLWTWTWNS